jgi:hypothetical protein
MDLKGYGEERTANSSMSACRADEIPPRELFVPWRDDEGEHVRACRAGYATIHRWCQSSVKKPQAVPWGASLFRCIRLIYGQNKEPTRGLEPLACSSYE